MNTTQQSEEQIDAVRKETLQTPSKVYYTLPSLVTEDNAYDYPLPIGSVVKWASWFRWKNEAGEEFIAYEIRATEPIPNDEQLIEVLPFRTIRVSFPAGDFKIE